MSRNGAARRRVKRQKKQAALRELGETADELAERCHKLESDLLAAQMTASALERELETKADQHIETQHALLSRLREKDEELDRAHAELRVLNIRLNARLSTEARLRSERDQYRYEARDLRARLNRARSSSGGESPVKELAKFLGGKIPKKLYTALAFTLHPDRWRQSPKLGQAGEWMRELNGLRER